MPEMTDLELVGYCEIHCETERALFIGRHVNRMIALAGYPKDFVRQMPEDHWVAAHEDMKRLCRLARTNLYVDTAPVVKPNNVVYLSELGSYADKP